MLAKNDNDIIYDVSYMMSLDKLAGCYFIH
jgi:hypothetical protein